MMLPSDGGGKPLFYLVNLSVGDTIFLPEGWSYIIKNSESSVLLWEQKLLVSGLETFAASGNNSEQYQHDINTLLKALQKNDELSGLWRRLSGVIKQINRK